MDTDHADVSICVRYSRRRRRVWDMDPARLIHCIWICKSHTLAAVDCIWMWKNQESHHHSTRMAQTVDCIWMCKNQNIATRTMPNGTNCKLHMNVQISETQHDDYNNTMLVQTIVWMCEHSNLTTTTISGVHKLYIAYECAKIRISTRSAHTVDSIYKCAKIRISPRQQYYDCTMHNVQKSASHQHDDYSTA